MEASRELAKAHLAAFDVYHTPGGSRDIVPAQPYLLLAIENFFSEAECGALIAAAHISGLQPPSAADLTPRKNEAFLNREKAAFIDATFAERVWSRLVPFLPEIDGRLPVGLHGDTSKGGKHSQMSYYRYARGMRFDQHVDQSWKGGPGEETEYTLLFYLNSAGEALASQGCDQPLQGGDTVFMATAKAELARVTPRAGLALLHAHGRRCLMHYAEEVTRGVKYVLRADVLYRRCDAAGTLNSAPASERSGTGTQSHSGKQKGKVKKK